MIRALASSALALAATGAALAGCARAVSNQFPPACPHAGILADAADITRFRPGGHDLTDMVLDGRITGVGGDCTREDGRTLKVTVHASVQLTRGPAAKGPVEDVPFFVAVSENGQLLDKQVYRIAPAFPRNSDTLSITTDDVSLTLPVSPDKPGSAYDLVVGFQLTPDELATNRRRGPR
jgi:hypothetical protein